MAALLHQRMRQCWKCLTYTVPVKSTSGGLVVVSDAFQIRIYGLRHFEPSGLWLSDSAADVGPFAKEYAPGHRYAPCRFSVLDLTFRC